MATRTLPPTVEIPTGALVETLAHLRAVEELVGDLTGTDAPLPPLTQAAELLEHAAGWWSLPPTLAREVTARAREIAADYIEERCGSPASLRREADELRAGAATAA
ncbi:MAG: hypothetical protein IRZ05_13100 [Micromonosporaceae bacterium]|nr:hypothetical protein [Micromonosporaceae bacterium]